jgi:sugar/nucleoside kinase (ribokinase family)
MKVDVLCIGDTVVDAFIKLQNAEVHCAIDSSKCTITMPFGAKIPYESAHVLYGVGNSANAAVSLSRLGLKAALMTDLGGDEYGENSRNSLRKENVLTDYVRLHTGVPTNYHYVLWYKDERTILVKHNVYLRQFDEKVLPECEYVYLSSLGADSLLYHDKIVNWLHKNPYVKLVFQPGTFQMQVGRRAMNPLYQMSYVFVCNFEEANYILEANLPKTRANIKKLLQKMNLLGPKIVVITDGPKGAYMYYERRCYFMPSYPDQQPPFERTGAGDAFTSTFLAGLCYGLSPMDALAWAPINSMNVVQHIGAQEGLLTKDELLAYLHRAANEYPDYKAEEI